MTPHLHFVRMAWIILKIFGVIIITWSVYKNEVAAEEEPLHQQVHLSFGSMPNEAVVTWATMEDIPDDCVVQYGSNGKMNKKSEAETSYFNKDKLYTHRARLGNLKPETIYEYRVGSPKTSWSKVFKFKTFPDYPKSNPNWMPKLLIYGDLGWQNSESLPLLEEEKDVDIIYHIGDLAYDLHDRGGAKGNFFMRSIENLAANTPYMTLPGNHERSNNFSHYDARFSMLGDYLNPQPKKPLHERINNHFHSEDVGPIHVISISTEFYYFTQWGWDQIRHQYEWLEEDLKRANQNRALRPWIMVLGHRPIYCLRMGDTGSCNHANIERATIRNGIQWEGKKDGELVYGLEKLFYKYGVDIQIYAHEHFYARFHPVYNHQVHDSDTKTVHDPAAPVHITTGCAGNRELHPAFNPNPKVDQYTVFRDLDYGYARMTFEDRLRFKWEEVSIDQGGIVIDEFTLSKSENRPAWLRN